MPGPLPYRVGQDIWGQILYLGQLQLLALVDVGASGEREQEQGGRPGPPQPHLQVCRFAQEVVEVSQLPVGLRPRVAREVASHVVVGQHPGGRSTDGACSATVVVITSRSADASQGAHRKSKLKAV